MPTRLRILYLSDLHERVALKWMSEDRKRQVLLSKGQRHRVLGANFLDVLRNIHTAHQVDLVCFTGDVADWGLKQEYDLATDW